MRLLSATVVLVLVSACTAQQCTFKDSGFKQCVSNYTSWVQVQLAQTKEFAVRFINAIPEPQEKLGEVHVLDPHHQAAAPHHHHSAPLVRRHNVLLRRAVRAVDDVDLDSLSEEFQATAGSPAEHDFNNHYTQAAQTASGEVTFTRGLTWQQFKQEVVQVVEKTIDNASREMTNGVESMTHPGGVHDVRSLICINASVSTLNMKGTAALKTVYEKLSREQRPRFEKALALPLSMAAKRVGEIYKGMEKEIKSCYFLLV